MDAFSVSPANGLSEPFGTKKRALSIAGIFALFQTAMPLLGWAVVHTMAELFVKFQKAIPYIALVLLLYIGGKMLWEAFRKKDEEAQTIAHIAFGTLLLQGVATSIDALSVGFTIAEYDFPRALVAALIIGALTLGICFAGVLLGKKFGTKFSGKAAALGGLVLIAVGIEIFLTGIF